MCTSLDCQQIWLGVEHFDALLNYFTLMEFQDINFCDPYSHSVNLKKTESSIVIFCHIYLFYRNIQLHYITFQDIWFESKMSSQMVYKKINKKQQQRAIILSYNVLIVGTFSMVSHICYHWPQLSGLNKIALGYVSGYLIRLVSVKKRTLSNDLHGIKTNEDKSNQNVKSQLQRKLSTINLGAFLCRLLFRGWITGASGFATSAILELIFLAGVHCSKNDFFAAATIFPLQYVW